MKHQENKRRQLHNETPRKQEKTTTLWNTKKTRQLHKEQAASWNEFPLEELAKNKIITSRETVLYIIDYNQRYTIE